MRQLRMKRHGSGGGHRVVVLNASLLVVLGVGVGAAAATSPAAHRSRPPGQARDSRRRTATLTLTGAGSTFDAPFFDLAFVKYEQLHPGVRIDYSAVGGSAGIKAFQAQKVDFGASDVPLTKAEQARAGGGAVVQVPVDLGAEIVVYNIESPVFVRLDLTGPVIARIFLGEITRWNDSAIAALNPRVSLPNERITVVHRSDGSGTTYIFSNYLASVSSTWASKVGVGKTLHWPTGIGAEGNAGVARAVAGIPFSIGYIEQSCTQATSFFYAAIRNQAGRYAVPSTTSIAAERRQNRISHRPTSPSSTSRVRTATRSAATAGRSSTCTSGTPPRAGRSSTS